MPDGGTHTTLTEVCVKHGPMAYFWKGERWCNCPSPVTVTCKRDQKKAGRGN